MLMAYVGLMLVIFWPDLALINSLLMKIPVGSSNLSPFGAVRCTDRSDMVEVVDTKYRRIGRTRREEVGGLWKKWNEMARTEKRADMK